MELKNKTFLSLKYLFISFFCVMNIDVVVAQKTMVYFELEDSVFVSRCDGYYVISSIDCKTFAQFKKGQRVGQWVTFSKDLSFGNLETYKKGKLNGFYSSFSQKGGTSGYYKKGLKHGEWKIGGDCETTEHYKKGVLNGYWEQSDIYGNFECGYYKKGKRNGKWIYKYNNIIYLIEEYESGTLKHYIKL